MIKKIERGDIVNIKMTENPFPHSLERCKVMWKPCDVGDSYTFESSDGSVFTINPICTKFIGLEFIERPEVES